MITGKVPRKDAERLSTVCRYWHSAVLASDSCLFSCADQVRLETLSDLSRLPLFIRCKQKHNRRKLTLNFTICYDDSAKQCSLLTNYSTRASPSPSPLASDRCPEIGLWRVLCALPHLLETAETAHITFAAQDAACVLDLVCAVFAPHMRRLTLCLDVSYPPYLESLDRAQLSRLTLPLHWSALSWLTLHNVGLATISESSTAMKGVVHLSYQTKEVPSDFLMEIFAWFPHLRDLSLVFGRIPEASEAEYWLSPSLATKLNVELSGLLRLEAQAWLMCRLVQAVPCLRSTTILTVADGDFTTRADQYSLASSFVEHIYGLGCDVSLDIAEETPSHPARRTVRAAFAPIDVLGLEDDDPITLGFVPHHDLDAPPGRYLRLSQDLLMDKSFWTTIFARRDHLGSDLRSLHLDSSVLREAWHALPSGRFIYEIEVNLRRTTITLDSSRYIVLPIPTAHRQFPTLRRVDITCTWGDNPGQEAGDLSLEEFWRFLHAAFGASLSPSTLFSLRGIRNVTYDRAPTASLFRRSEPSWSGLYCECLVWCD